jgi:hypothetical protein
VPDISGREPSDQQFTPLPHIALSTSKSALVYALRRDFPKPRSIPGDFRPGVITEEDQVRQGRRQMIDLRHPAVAG